jgi:pimeloyl-ACP methyl ester carboxylesterase
MKQNRKKKCEVIDIITPQKIVLNGLLFGPNRASTGFIYIPGLSGNVFSKLDMVAFLAGKNFLVLSLNTRGHDKVTRMKKLDKRTKKGYQSIRAGGAHEVFTDCKDDLAGAVKFMLDHKVKNIYLVGHSTGCQKSVYYLAYGKYREKVKGVILLCPMSDYAAAVKEYGEQKLKKIGSLARQMVRTGHGHSLLPLSLWSGYDDAQRFLSLYTPNSAEEIFSYVDKNKNPKTLLKVKQPLLVVLAGQDEYQDRPTKQIANWFYIYLQNKKSLLAIFPAAKHSLSGFEKDIVKKIHQWIEGGLNGR